MLSFQKKLRSHSFRLPRWSTVLVLSVSFLPALHPFKSPFASDEFIYALAAACGLFPTVVFWVIAKRTRTRHSGRIYLLGLLFLISTFCFVFAALNEGGAVDSRKALWLLATTGSLRILVALLALVGFPQARTAWLSWIDLALVLIFSTLFAVAKFTTVATGQADSFHLVTFLSDLFILAAALTHLLSSTEPQTGLVTRVLILYYSVMMAVVLLVDIGITWCLHGRFGDFGDTLICIPVLAAGLLGLQHLRLSPMYPGLVPKPFLRNCYPLTLVLGGVLIAIVALHHLPFALASTLVVLTFLYAVRMQLVYNSLLAEQRYLLLHTGHLEQLAMRDPLTSIGNRRFLDEVSRELLRSQPSTCVALMLLDVDHFKQINDRAGHLQGDKILRAVAQELDRVVSTFTEASCARSGGDEFVAILRNVGLNQTMKAAEQLRTAVASLPFASSLRLSVSIGVAFVERPAALDRLLQLADEALYCAKSRGRNFVALAGQHSLEREASSNVLRLPRNINPNEFRQ